MTWIRDVGSNALRLKNFFKTMTNTEIIKTYADRRFVEGCLKTMKAARQETEFNLKDLAQDIYLSLLQKPANLIESLYEGGELDYYITGMIANNVLSKTSPYHLQYRIKDEPQTGNEGLRASELDME